MDCISSVLNLSDIINPTMHCYIFHVQVHEYYACLLFVISYLFHNFPHCHWGGSAFSEAKLPLRYTVLSFSSFSTLIFKITICPLHLLSILACSSVPMDYPLMPLMWWSRTSSVNSLRIYLRSAVRLEFLCGPCLTKTLRFMALDHSVTWLFLLLSYLLFFISPLQKFSGPLP